MVMGLGTCLHGGVEGTGPGGQQVWSSHLLLGQLQIGPLEAVISHMEDSSSQPPSCWGWFNSHCVMHLCKVPWSPGEGLFQSHYLCCNLAAQYVSRGLGGRPHRVSVREEEELGRGQHYSVPCECLQCVRTDLLLSDSNGTLRNPWCVAQGLALSR